MYDIIIVGAGTAGMTAALYALRNNKTVLLVEGGNIGGQIANSPRVENFPTVRSISGAELADNLYEQVTALGAELELDRAVGVEKRADGTFCVRCEYASFEGRSVIVASGVKHKKLNVPGEEELAGSGVSYCAVCDGPFYSGEEVAVVGDANTALQYAIMLSAYCRTVHVCTWMDRFFGDTALVDTLLSKPNVRWHRNLNLVALEGEGELAACSFVRTATTARAPEPQGDIATLNLVYDEKGSEFRLPVKACFVAIGQVPDNEAFRSLADLDEAGYIVAGEDCLTRTPGLFVAGDCRTKAVRQLTTAAADGAVAALAAVKYLG